MKTIYWRPCPFFCPDLPGYFRSWADLMVEKERLCANGEPITIDVPEGTPFPRGTHDMRGSYVDCTGDLPQIVGDDPGSRCVPEESP